MQLLFFVLNRSEMLDDILTSFADHDIHGATILDSKGMVHLLASHSDEGEVPFFGAMRAFLKPERENSNLIIAAVNDDLSKPDTGVVFTVPISYVKGLYKDGN